MRVSSAEVSDLEQRVRALESERDDLARQLADARAAIRLREEIFAVTVHDLRNPLGTVVMGATALLANEDSDPRAQRVRTVAERIARQAERMSRQLSNLSDFGEIQAGRLALDRSPHKPGAILSAARDQLEPLARERGVACVMVDGDLTTLQCDADRVVQALFNLAGAALKVTGRGGEIELGSHDGTFFVRDHVPTADMGRGAGLAHTIAQGIAEAHGGRLWSERSDADRTVFFRLTGD